MTLHGLASSVGNYSKHIILALFYIIWEYVIRKSEKLAALSLLNLVLPRKKGETIMEHDQNIGTVGKLQLSFSGGKAQLTANATLPGGLTVAITVADDASALIDQLEAIVAKALPATAPVDPAIFGVIKAAVLAIQ